MVVLLQKLILQLSVEVWNHHAISLKGRPVDLMAQNNKTVPVDQLMRNARTAEHYRRVTRRQLTSISIFGIDPLAEYTNSQIQSKTETLRKFSFKSIFCKFQQENVLEFMYSIHFFLRVSFVLLQTKF